MTTFDRFDPFERRIGEALEGIAPPRPLDYLDDVFRQTARSSQRPRWSFRERWFNVDTTMSRSALPGGVSIRPLLILLLLAALVGGAVLAYVGTHRTLQPFGPAGNGALVYQQSGDLYVRDSFTGTSRLLVGGPGDQIAATFSPDGTRLAYATTEADGDHWFIANADGTNPIAVGVVPPTGNATGNWAPDSRHTAMIYDVAGAPTLRIIDATTGKEATLQLGDLRPWDVVWTPPNGDRLLIRAESSNGTMDVYTLRPDGTDLKPFHMPNGRTEFGSAYTLSGLASAPDGGTIAYNSVESVDTLVGNVTVHRSHFRVRLMGPDGSNDRAVASPPSPWIQEAWPTYSPDGKWIVVQRWVFKGDAAYVPEGLAQGWLAIMPADGSTPARDIGPRIAGGEDSSVAKTWSPDGTRILMSASNTNQVFSIDPLTGTSEVLPWTQILPDWQRIAR